MMVQINPNTTGGLPSTRSAGLMFTNLIFLLAKNCRAVFALLKKCGRRKTRPLSMGSFSPDNTSSSASSLVPSRKSWIRSAIRSGGTRCVENTLIILVTICNWYFMRKRVMSIILIFWILVSENIFTVLSSCFTHTEMVYRNREKCTFTMGFLLKY